MTQAIDITGSYRVPGRKSNGLYIMDFRVLFGVSCVYDRHGRPWATAPVNRGAMIGTL
ncbi:hypothetical protein [Thioalkalivibrio thiocyanodenitrificans]|uniref:hypothetical protein n=1 Tax=Thioalkalivibrio thiocyanodenitrificans TaxID=243063 RepID=UPI0012EA2A74|nr:hypothetical protein [Thioalkalivibrio thiocyanodenitrificans]